MSREPVATEPAVVDLRGPCGHLMAQLDPAQRLLVRKCRECSRREGRAVYHAFDIETGEMVQISAKDE